MLIVVVWTVIALGLYRCSVQMADADEHADERAAGNTDEGEQVAQPDPDETAGEVTTEENVPETPFDENVRILLWIGIARGFTTRNFILPVRRDLQSLAGKK